MAVKMERREWIPELIRRPNQQALGIAWIWVVRGRNRLTGPPRVLAWVSDEIRNTGGEAGWLPCSSLRCLGLLRGEGRVFVRFTLCRIIGFQMPAEGLLMLSVSQHTGHRIQQGAASPQNCGKTRYHPWHLCLGGNSLLKQG